MALPLTHKHVLVVEDEQHFRSVLVSYLKSLSAETSKANNGLQVMNVMDDVTPDLILSDLVMLEMGGIEFVENLCLQGYRSRCWLSRQPIRWPILPRCCGQVFRMYCSNR